MELHHSFRVGVYIVHLGHRCLSCSCSSLSKCVSKRTLDWNRASRGFYFGTESFCISGVFVSQLRCSFIQVWLFISPGLYEHERRYVLPFVLATSALFFVGVWFSFDIVLPFAFDFFKKRYDIIGVTPRIRISEHLSLILKAMLGFGAVFEMPVLAFLLGRLGVIDHLFLLRGFRYAVVLIFIISAILTPPDVLTQLLMAGPLLLLYGLSILIVKFTGRPKLKVQDQELEARDQET